MFNVQNCTVKCWGESYCWLILGENINIYVCVCQRKYVIFMLLRAYRVAGLRVNMLKDNIEMDITKMALMFSGLNVINT